jgi:YD repeat-containing protein
MNKQFCIYVVFFVFHSFVGFSQENGDFETPNQFQFPTIPTPNESALLNSSRIPAATYNGSIGISIPVYVIKDRQIEIPISLNYQASGIKVEQEASWVGLGWNLSVGGAITRLINGHRDDICYDFDSEDRGILRLAQDRVSEDGPVIPFFTHDLISVGYENPTYINNAVEDYMFLYGEKGLPPCQKWMEHSPIPRMFNEGWYKPDLFSFSYLGKSGKFFKRHSEGTYEQIDAQGTLQINSMEGNTGWFIVDESGVKYIFDEPQKKWDSFQTIPEERRLPVTHYLSRIEYPNGQSVDFVYEELAPVSSLAQKNERLMFYSPNSRANGPTYQEIGWSYQEYWPKYLKQIRAGNYMVDFERETGRSDIPGEDKLKKIVVSNLFSDFEKEFVFNYDYFSAGTGSSSRITDRLKLVSVLDCEGRLHEFKYVDKRVPSKQSMARDFWGYYNGVEDNITLLPKLKHIDGLSGIYEEEFQDAYDSRFSSDRRPSSEHIGWGMLEKIIHPTGGWTTYEFEPHRFSNFLYDYLGSGGRSVKEGASDREEITINVIERVDVDIRVEIGMPYIPGRNLTIDEINSLLAGSYCALYENGELINRFVAQYEGGGNSSGAGLVSCNETIEGFNFAPGNDYVFIAYLSEDAMNYKESYPSSAIYCEIYTDIPKYALEGCDNERYSIGAGMRIKSIKKFDSNGNQLLHKAYTYEGENASYGKLMSRLNYQSMFFEFHDGGGNQNSRGWVNCLKVDASSNIGISNSANNSPVGYSQVIEKMYNKHGDYNGRIVNSYHNQSSLAQIEGIPEIPYLLNGKLKSKVVMDNNNDTISRVDFKYLKKVNSNYFGLYCPSRFYSLTGSPAGDFDLSHLNDDYFDYYQREALSRMTNVPSVQFVTYAYLIPASTFKLSKQVSVSYDKGERGVVEEVETNYNSNLQVKSKIEKIVGGEKEIKYAYYYPDDYMNNPVIEPLLDNRILDRVVKAERLVDRQLTDGKVTRYNSIGLPLEIFNYQQSGLKASQEHDSNELIPDDYFLTKKVLYKGSSIPKEIVKTNDRPIYYYWGYNDQFVVAKMGNVSATDIDNNVGLQNALNQLSSFTHIQSADKLSLANLNREIRNLSPIEAEIYTYTYDPLIGITSQTDPNGITTYYEYDGFGLLKCVRDDEGNILNTFEYHYQTQE